jgi:ATP-dependent Clp protease ATP-binding subunit ClpC
VEENVLSAVKQTFSPEFLNRLDEIIVFDELSDEDLLEIIDLQVNQLNKTLETRGWTVSLTEEARGWLMEKTCKDRTYGARPLRRALQRYVEDLLADAAISGKIEGAETIEIFRENDLLDFRVLKRESKKTKNDEIKEVLNFEL